MEGSDGRPVGNLARQPSIYALTFDEFQNTLGGHGKDFGSMNMDEFLKNIWTAEEMQAMASSMGSAEPGSTSGNLQRQGSLTLPRTLSQKTVDEVWKDLFKENGGTDGTNTSGPNLQQRQQTLGEMTLEEFLVRAGVVREDAQLAARPNNNNSGFYTELSQSNNNNAALSLGYQQSNQSNGLAGVGIMENNATLIPNQSPNLSINGVVAQQQLFPNRFGVESVNPSMRIGISNSVITNGRGQGTAGTGSLSGGAGIGVMGLGTGAVSVTTASSANQLSSDGVGKRDGDSSSLSPAPYNFNGSLRGRKCGGTVEKVVERRQRRMIKNRESAARSRARKQVPYFFKKIRLFLIAIFLTMFLIV